MERLSIYIPPETYVLPRVAVQRIRGRALRWPSFVDLTLSSFEYHPEFETFNIDTLRDYAMEAKTWSRDRQNFESLILGLYSHLATVQNVEFSWLGDKTPLNTLHIKRLTHIIPNARYIFVFRDGVDVAWSYLNSGIYDSLTEAARRWVLSQKSWYVFRRSLLPHEYLEIRYEDLVASPETNIEKVAFHFGIPLRQSEISVTEALGDVGRRSHHHKVSGVPNIESIGKGRRSLSEDDAKKLRPILSGWLEYCGYSGI